MHASGVLCLSATFWLIPAAAIAVVLAVLEPFVWKQRRPRHWWFYGVAVGLGLVLTPLISYLSDRFEGDALVWWPLVLVAIAAIWLIRYSAKRSFDPFFGTLAVVSGACLFVSLDALITGPGDGTGLWGIGFLLNWWLLGIPLAIIAIIQSLVWAFRR